MKYNLEQLKEMMEENGGYLYLNGCTGLTSLPEGLTVGSYLSLEGCTGLTSREKKKAHRAEHSLKNGAYCANRFIFCDGILTHVKRERKIGDYIYYIGKIKNKNVIFDGENYAHCKKFSSGVIDLNFKKAKDRGADQYKKYTLESIVSKNEAITMYRIITGACQAGTDQFISSLKELKKEYSIKEIIEITKGHYGAADFARFFKEE